MAAQLVTRERLEAGKRYLEALQLRGFVPEGALWSARPGEEASLELSLFTAVVGEVGSLAMFRELFEAFERRAIPGDVDPWDIGLYGPGQMFYEAIRNCDLGMIEDAIVVRMGEDGEISIHKDAASGRAAEENEDRLIRREWIYRWPSDAELSQASQLDGWHRFVHAAAQAA